MMNSLIISNVYKFNTVEPLLKGNPFCAKTESFQEGWPLGSRGQNQCIHD